MRLLPSPVSSGSLEFDFTATFVYYAWDKDGDLLYVGVTDDLPRRLAGHRQAHAEWTRYAVRLTWDRYATRDEGEWVESRQIKTLLPRYNIRDNGRRVAAERMGMRHLHDTAASVRLGEVVRQDRGRMSQMAAARVARISVEDWRAVEARERQRHPKSALSGVELALRWHPGSVEAVLSGGEPDRFTEVDNMAHAMAAMAAFSPGGWI